MPDPIRSFEDLRCWRACRDFRLFVARKVAPALPGEERYRLRTQLLNAARSVTANIAEGYGRYHFLDNAKFCRNARGSCYEVLDHLLAASDEGLIGPELLEEGRRLFTRAIVPLNGYISYLTRASKGLEADNQQPTTDNEQPRTNNRIQPTTRIR